MGNDMPSAALLQANEENAAACFGSLRRAPAVAVDDRAGRLRVATGIGHPIFNGVYSTHLPVEETDAYIEATRAHFALTGLPWRWWIWPQMEPADLQDRLAARGLVPRGVLTAMSVDLRATRDDRPDPAGLLIERVATKEGLALAADIAGATFGLPPEKRPRYLEVFSALGFAAEAAFQSYVGYVAGAPVAVSQSFIDDGVVGIYTVATLPEYRGRGYGAALTLAPLRDARTRNCRYGILQSTEMGRRVYERLGFRADGDVVLYGLPPVTP